MLLLASIVRLFPPEPANETSEEVEESETVTLREAKDPVCDTPATRKPNISKWKFFFKVLQRVLLRWIGRCPICLRDFKPNEMEGVIKSC